MENEENQELELDDQNEELEETQDGDEVDYKALYEQKAHEAKKLKRKLFSKNAEQPQAKETITRSSDQKWMQRMELRVEGYDDEAIDFLLKNGGKKALENQYIVSAIESMKEMKKAAAATIENEGQKSSVEKRFTPGDFAKLSHEDQLKALSELR